MKTYYTAKTKQLGDKTRRKGFRMTVEQDRAIKQLVGKHEGIYCESQAIRYLIDLGIQQVTLEAN